MKSILNITVTLTVFATLVGCGNNKKSGNSNSGVVVQGTCSQDTLQLFKELKRKSDDPITRNTRVNQIHQSCLQLQQDLGGGACRDLNSNSRNDQYVAYSQVSSYCAEVATYVTQRDPVPAPRPVPAPQPAPGVRPPKYQNVLLGDFSHKHVLYFEKSFLDAQDLDKRNSQVRCQLTIPSRENGRLRNVRATVAGYSAGRLNSNSFYDLTMRLSGSGDLMRLNCKSQKPNLTIYEVNNLLDGVAEFR